VRPASRPVAALLLAAGVIAVTAQQTPPGDVPAEALALLQRELGFSDANVQALARGNVIRRTLAPTDPGEVVAAGAVRVEIPREFLLAQVRNIVAFKQSKYVLEIGVFGASPRIDDLAGLSLSADDVEAMRKCAPGRCDFKLTAAMLERVQSEIDWTRADQHARVSALFRQLLAERAAAYLAGGPRTLGTYIDKADANAMGDDLASLFAGASYLAESASELRLFFTEFPHRRLAGADGFLYWSKEAYQLKPVISVTHVAIYSTTIGTARASFIASQGLYASHYFEGSLALTLAIEAQAPESPAIYLIYVNRSRVDALGGGFGGLKRWIASRRVRDGMETTLKGLKQRLETDYSAPSPRTSSPTTSLPIVQDIGVDPAASPSSPPTPASVRHSAHRATP
jgi:hypothetical protein